METQYKLVSFKLCPFVQRSLITLEEKGVPYDIEYIDLANKPDWFLELSPLGKVPILQVDGTVVFESAVINEYIEETTSGAPMHPADPLARARNRSWIEVASDLTRRGHKVFHAADEQAACSATVNVRSKLALFEDELAGPLFNGEEMSLVDAAAAPILQRLSWCDEITPSLCVFKDVPRVSAWRDTLLARPSVQRSTVPEIKKLFRDYLKRAVKVEGQGRPSWLGTQV
jgi:glutathione S-transferase